MQAVDVSAPTMEVEMGDYFIVEVLIDGGFGVNIMTYETMQKSGLNNLKLIPFVIQLANQQLIKPMGILRGVKMVMSSLTFSVKDRKSVV